MTLRYVSGWYPQTHQRHYIWWLNDRDSALTENHPEGVNQHSECLEVMTLESISNFPIQ